MHVIRHIHTAASRVRILPDGGLKRAAAASAADELLKSPPPAFYLFNTEDGRCGHYAVRFIQSLPPPALRGRQEELCAYIYYIMYKA